MAADKVEYQPLLEPGFHEIGLDGLRRMAVDRFRDSITRGTIMANLDTVTGMINQSLIKGDIWIDGSFLTEKLNPDDVDFIFIVEADNYAGLSSSQTQFFEWFRTTKLHQQYRLDNYGIVYDKNIAVCEYMRAYWLRQFGFSRADEMKGLAVIKVPYLVTP